MTTKEMKMKKWFATTEPMRELRAKIESNGSLIVVKENGLSAPTILHTLGLWKAYQIPELLIAAQIETEVLTTVLAMVCRILIRDRSPNYLATRIKGVAMLEHYALAAGTYGQIRGYMPLAARFYSCQEFPAFQVLMTSRDDEIYADVPGSPEYRYWPRVFR